MNLLLTFTWCGTSPHICNPTANALSEMGLVGSGCGSDVVGEWWWRVTVSFSSFSSVFAKWTSAEAVVWRERMYMECDDEKECRASTKCFMQRFLALQCDSDVSSLAILECQQQPIRTTTQQPKKTKTGMAINLCCLLSGWLVFVSFCSAKTVPSLAT